LRLQVRDKQYRDYKREIIFLETAGERQQILRLEARDNSLREAIVLEAARKGQSFID